MKPRETLLVAGRRIGGTVHVFDSLPSTNDSAAEMGTDPAHAGAAFVADEQTAGRGQYGRIWHSRAGSSLLMSVVVPLAPHSVRPAVLTAWAACAIAAAVETLCGTRPRLKWPNDLLVNERKICGILIEQSQVVVLGLGLNIDQTQEEFAEAGLPEATSLRLLRESNAERVTASVVREVVLAELNDGFLRCFSIDGDRDADQEHWRSLIGLEGAAVVVECHDGSIHFGRLRTLSFAGLELDVGEVVPMVLAPEAIRGLRAL